MNKIKDFIYDKSDIVIALLILVVAGLIIFWRMNVILDYPTQMLGNSSDTNVTLPADDDEKKDDEENTKPSKEDNQGSQASQGSENSNQPAAELPLWKDGALTKDVEVRVDGTTASEAIQCLVDAKLFDDYAEYERICKSSGMDHEKVKAGTFTFEKGSTKANIARMMNWS